MKRSFALLLGGILMFAAVGLTWAQSTDNEQHAQSIDQVLSQIRTVMGLSPNERIDPSNVPSRLLVELGDAVMDVMVPNEQEHQFMDNMMGGEGSASLDAMHTWIAYRYLGGGYSRSAGGYGMMGGAMMGGGYLGGVNGSWGMMGNPAVPYGSYSSQTPEEIAKSRYARGEITRDQYLQLMKDLQQGTGGKGS